VGVELNVIVVDDRDKAAPAEVSMSETVADCKPPSTRPLVVVTVKVSFRSAPGGELLGIGFGLIGMGTVELAGTWIGSEGSV
jgi:hypothetical protein